MKAARVSSYVAAAMQPQRPCGHLCRPSSSLVVARLAGPRASDRPYSSQPMLSSASSSTASPMSTSRPTPRPLDRLHTPAPLRRRSFSHTARAGKKNANKGQKKGSDTGREQKSSAAAATGAAANPFDLGDLEAALASVAKQYKEQLKLQSASGRFNADALGRLPVRPDRHQPQVFPLRELATVVQQGGDSGGAAGRYVAILAHEAAHVPAILSAVQGSPDFNQQPQRSADNPLELTVRIEAEPREAVEARVKETCHAWRGAVREERQKKMRMMSRWKDEGVVGVDDLKRLNNAVEKAVKELLQDVDVKEKEALKQVASKKGR